MKPVMVGENNPYGGEPEFALYPSPRGCTGWRLCHLILRMDPDAYCDTFDRRNLLALPKWSAPAAREAARALLAEVNGAPIILLGAKVCAAFGEPYFPYSVRADNRLAILPHPSGLNRAWGIKGSFDRARATVQELLAPGKPTKIESGAAPREEKRDEES